MRRWMRACRRIGFGPAVALAATGCGEGLLCTTEAVPAVTVEVRDAGTGDPAADGAVAVVQDGEYVEGLEVVAWESNDPASGYLMAGAYERPGVYTLTITRAGYQTWVASGLVAEAGQCHVAGVSVEALLEAA